MKDVGYVFGSAEQAQELVIGKDTVYVHSEITLVESEEGEERPSPIYRYHEIQYEKDEYIKLVTEITRADIDYIAIMTGVEL